MASWGNSQSQQYYQDMESPTGYHLLATNHDANDFALKGHNDDGIAIHSDGDFKVDGNSDFNGTLDVTHHAAASAAVINNSTFAGLALEVNGRLDVTAIAGGTITAEITNTSDSGRALKVNGVTEIGCLTDDSTLIVNNSDDGGLALDVNGRADIITDHLVYETLKVTNQNAAGPAINCQGRLEVKAQIKFNQDGNAYIDSYDDRILNLNTQSESSLVVIGKTSGADTQIAGLLRVRDDILPLGESLNLGVDSSVSSVIIGPSGLTTSNTIVGNRLKCQFGLDHPSSAGTLPIGASCNGVDLAAATKNTHVKGKLEVDEEATFNDTVQCERSLGLTGDFQVLGFVDIDNTVDLDVDTTGIAMDVNNASTDPSAVAIKATAPLALDARGKASFADHIALTAGKRLALDGTTGQNYVRYNSAQSRMEFFIGGTLVFVIDSSGGHNP